MQHQYCCQVLYVQAVSSAGSSKHKNSLEIMCAYTLSYKDINHSSCSCCYIWTSAETVNTMIATKSNKQALLLLLHMPICRVLGSMIANKINFMKCLLQLTSVANTLIAKVARRLAINRYKQGLVLLMGDKQTVQDYNCYCSKQTLRYRRYG